MSEYSNIVFFFCFCVLCNKFIFLLFKIDKRNNFIFTPLQGETAKKLYPGGELEKFDSIAFMQNGKLYYKSTAAIKICITVGGIWRLIGAFYIFPAFIRDFFYDIIAKNRYKWFGKKETCRMPTLEEREKLLP